MKFDIIQQDAHSKARLGRLETAHSVIDTPVFMPVGTRGAVKTLTNQQLIDLDAQIILGNTYHLMLRPGKAIMDQAGGLHAFMGWPRSSSPTPAGFRSFPSPPLTKYPTAESNFSPISTAHAISSDLPKAWRSSGH